MMITLWLCCTAVLSIPTVLYALSTAIPGDDNTWNISAAVLRWSFAPAGFTLYFVSSVVIPKLARLLPRKFNHGEPDPALACRFIMSARFLVALVIPAVVVFVVSTDCMGGWLKMWSACQDEGDRFNIDTTLVDPMYTKYYSTGSVVSSFVTTPAVNLTVVTHGSICEPLYVTGRCPRSIIDALATLLLKKCIVATFVAPAIALFVNIPKVRETKERLIHLVSSSYTAQHSIDVELAGLVTFAEYAIAFGFVVPALLPLLCLQHATRLAVLHFAAHSLGLESKNVAKPSSRYLLASLVFGLSLLIWLYADNQWHGRYLVFFGVPVVSAVTYTYTTSHVHSEIAAAAVEQQQAKTDQDVLVEMCLEDSDTASMTPRELLESDAVVVQSPVFNSEVVGRSFVVEDVPRNPQPSLTMQDIRCSSSGEEVVPTTAPGRTHAVLDADVRKCDSTSDYQERSEAMNSAEAVAIRCGVVVEMEEPANEAAVAQNTPAAPAEGTRDGGGGGTESRAAIEDHPLHHHPIMRNLRAEWHSSLDVQTNPLAPPHEQAGRVAKPSSEEPTHDFDVVRI